MSNKTGVMLLSGGMDSATLLWWLLKHGHTVHCLSVDYGQRHDKELGAAESVYEAAHKRFSGRIGACRQLDLSISGVDLLLKGSSQSDNSITVPYGAYDDEVMKTTVVPNRNMMMLSFAIAWAISKKMDHVWYGAHSGDHAIYPDCRPEFVQALALATELADWHQPKLTAPFITMDKGDIALLGRSLGVPYGKTWTCYEGKEDPCGKCGACVERAEAFAFADFPDPLLAEV
jgi:7-cyano-7-deazaguanine synthase